MSFHVWINIDHLPGLIVPVMSADAPGFRQSLAGFAAEFPRQCFISRNNPDAVKRNDTWGFPGRLLIRGNLFPAFPYICFIFHFLKLRMFAQIINECHHTDEANDVLCSWLRVLPYILVCLLR